MIGNIRKISVKGALVVMLFSITMIMGNIFVYNNASIYNNYIFAEEPSANDAQEQLDDQFFDSPSEPAASEPAASEPETEPKSSQPEQSTPVSENVTERLPIGEVIPGDALAIIRLASLRTLDEKGKLFLNRLGLGTFSPLGWIRLSHFGKSLDCLDPEVQLGIVYLGSGNQLKRMFILPVRDYAAFASSLGGDVSSYNGKIPEKTLLAVKTPADCYTWQQGGYAFLVQAASREDAEQYLAKPSFFSRGRFAQSGVGSSHVVIEITPRGIGQFATLAETALYDSIPVVSGAQSAMNVEFVQNDFPSRIVSRLSRILPWINNNLDRLRIDLVIEEDTTLVSASLIPRPSSELEYQMRDPSTSIVPATLELNRPLKVLAEYPAPIFGQADISRSVASKLQAPFNRIRHLEYSIGLPSGNQLLAESFAFFLEVDDAGLFVQELIVPKAQMIGGYIGSEKLGAIGAQVLGNFATRRQYKTGGRSRLDPARAADFGARIGSQIGSEVGRNMAEKQAMTIYNFDGYPMYRTDLVLYTEQMNRIRAIQDGRAAPEPIRLTGEPSLRIYLGQMLCGLMTGNGGGIHSIIGSSLSGGTSSAAPGDMPLVAKENMILILDRQHLLICPGNEQLLRLAKENWQAIRSYYQPFEAYHPVTGEPIPVWEPQPATALLDTTVDPRLASLVQQVLREVPGLERHTIRTITCLDLVAARWFAGYLNGTYVPNLNTPFLNTLPDNAPQILSMSTTNGDVAHLYSLLPHELTRDAIQGWLKLKAEKENNASETSVQTETKETP